MSQNSSSVSSLTGPDFNLPDSILSIIPTDPYDQLDLARKITSMAIASRVSKLESENGRIRQKLQEKDCIIGELQDNVTRLENDRVQMESRLRIVVEENMKLLKERDSLSLTAKKLSRDLVKLETFKRQLMQSLNDDNSAPTENVNTTSYQSKPKAYPVEDEEAIGNVRQYSSSGSTESDSSLVAQRASVTSYIPPRLTQNGTPKVISTSGSPRGYSTAGTPRKSSGSTTPTSFQFESRSELPWHSYSQQSSAANSPPRGQGHQNPGRPQIDGKEFFRQARNRLSFEQFSAFLANIKELNAQKQSREETLTKAEEIFGKDNRDLYLSFQGMLTRNIR